MDKAPGIVYYYCKPHVFKGMIEDKELWLCDMAKTNDYKEVWHALESLIDKVKSGDNDLTGSLKESVAANIDEACKILHDRNCWLATCFTQMGDHLAHWRTYGFNGKGYCIGFDHKMLGKMREENPKLLFDKMRYSERSKTSYIREIFHSFYYKLQSAEWKSKVTVDILVEILQEYARKMCYTKNLGFEYEEEWRLSCMEKYSEIQESICKMPLRDKAEEMKEKIPYGVSIGERNAKIYIKQSFPVGMIKEVFIGPRNGATENEIKLLLMLNGFDVAAITVKKSDATYCG